MLINYSLGAVLHLDAALVHYLTICSLYSLKFCNTNSLSLNLPLLADPNYHSITAEIGELDAIICSVIISAVAHRLLRIQQYKSLTHKNGGALPKQYPYKDLVFGLIFFLRQGKWSLSTFSCQYSSSAIKRMVVLSDENAWDSHNLFI